MKEKMGLRRAQKVEAVDSVEHDSGGEQLGKFDLTRNQITEIERDLEQTAAEKAVAKQITQLGIAEKIRDPRVVSRTIAAGMFALGLHTADVFGAEPKTEKRWTPEQEQTLEQVTGMPFAELKKKFDIDISVTPGAGSKYIVHIGQTHEHPGGGIFKALTQKQVIESQMRIEGLAATMVTQNKFTCIFSEGIARTDVARNIRDTIRDDIQELDAILARPIESYEDFNAAYQVFRDTQDHLRHRVGRHYLSAKMDQLSKIITTTIQEKPDLFQTEYQKMGANLAEMTTMSMSFGNLVGNMGATPNPYAAGTDFKLLMDGKVGDLCATEESGANERAMAMLKAKSDAQTALDRARNASFAKFENDPQVVPLFTRRVELMEKEKSNNLTPEEKDENERTVAQLQALYKNFTSTNDPETMEAQKNFDQAQAQYNELVYLEREKAAIARIDQRDQHDIGQGTPLNNVLMIYGESHDFTKALNLWNTGDSAHHPIQRGLIKLSVKE